MKKKTKGASVLGTGIVLLGTKGDHLVERYLDI